MIFGFSKKGKMMVNMIEYIKIIVVIFPEENNHVKDQSNSRPPFQCARRTGS